MEWRMRKFVWGKVKNNIKKVITKVNNKQEKNA